MAIIKKYGSKVLPVGTKRRRVAEVIIARSKRLKKGTSKQVTFAEWVSRHEAGIFSYTDKKLKKITKTPHISIVVPCYNTPDKYIIPLVDSVISQVYKHWELCIVDGSTDKERSKKLRHISEQDPRIKLITIGSNLGIVGNTNEGIKAASGEFVAFLDHDDLLSPYALAEVVLAYNDNSELDLIYSDEDKISDNGKERILPFFKPDWSPELLLGVNYITHFVVARKSVVDKIGGLRSGFDGAQDYDFLLRFTEETTKIHHIPKLLYHWRLAEGSTAIVPGEKNYADAAGQRALRDATKRRGIQAKVIEIADRPTNYRLKYALPKNTPLVSIIIPFKDKADLLKQCVSSILEKSTYRNFELILLTNNSTEPETYQYLETLKNENRCRIFTWDRPFNYSAINNYGSKKAKGEYLILLNNDTEVITPEWIEELIGVASQPSIGAVGPLLHYADGTIQHAGVVLGMNTMAGHAFRRRLPLDWTEYGIAAWPRNYLAVTGACLAIRKKTYEKMGGLDEEFTIAGNDVALGIKLYESGYRNVYWPFAELVHYENVSVGSYNNVPQKDYDHSLDYYGPYLNWQDPYFNPNLSLMNEQITLREEY